MEADDYISTLSDEDLRKILREAGIRHHGTLPNTTKCTHMQCVKENPRKSMEKKCMDHGPITRCVIAKDFTEHDLDFVRFDPAYNSL